ncbi:MAG: hypothetical protein II670_07100 [Alphaproteobacteria bacterium]|nr:hypothetical protein [Alphaproteobacteria bacterium]
MARKKNDGRGRIGGRAKGTPNKISKDLRLWIYNLVNGNRTQIKKDLKSLSPKDRLAILEKLMQYVVPKQQAVQFDYSQLDEEQLDVIINQLKEDLYEV